jgi:hypothetical protein
VIKNLEIHMPRLLPAVAFLILSLIAPAAYADDDLPKPESKDFWHIITQDDASTTSACIGKRDKPLCAIDTALAAQVRADEGLWFFAHGRAKPQNSDLHGEDMFIRREGLWKQYQVLNGGYFQQGDPAKDERGKPLGWVSGDIWVTIFAEECYPQTPCGKSSQATRQRLAERYILHKSQDGWILVRVVNVHQSQL